MFDVKDTDLFDLEEEEFDTVLASDIAFSGTIHFQRPFMIKGKMNGTIDATSDLVVDTNAEVQANILADRVLVRGKVTGNVTGKKLVFITASGSVNGDIETAQIVLEPGCVFSGKCSMLK